MKYRTKLLFTFIVVGLVTNGISLGLLYFLARRSLYDFYGAKLLSTTATTAAMVNAEDLKAIHSAAKELGVGILISEYTHNALRGSFRFRSMGSVHVKGRADPVLTYSLEEDKRAGLLEPEPAAR
ncbi:MAG TPA: hypothetical protein VEU96_07740 [Bryobacteraceae bacterium]|nr:hypothetical protein [Bryobacteraceae bacterium]